jgi:hypothetical protein
LSGNTETITNHTNKSDNTELTLGI